MNRTEFIGTYLYYSQDFVDDLYKEIERIKTDYQQANDIIVEQSKEIENLINDLEREKSQVKEYGTRLLKAIEYIERRDIDWGSEEHTELLNILEGDKDGEN